VQHGRGVDGLLIGLSTDYGHVECIGDEFRAHVISDRHQPTISREYASSTAAQ
jgi:hypothetical protein